MIHTEKAAEEQTQHRRFPLWGGWYEFDNRGEEPSEIEEYLQDVTKEDNEVFGIAHSLKDVVFQPHNRRTVQKGSCSFILSSRM